MIKAGGKGKERGKGRGRGGRKEERGGEREMKEGLVVFVMHMMFLFCTASVFIII